MRLRIMALAATAAAFAMAAGPATATAAAAAATQQARGLTIHAVPRSIMAGDPVLLYGRLEGPRHANQLIRLFHRINPRPLVSLIQTTRSDSAGRYEFVRLHGIVDTNRSWSVRGPGFTHSETVHEQVQALVTLAASALQGTTRHQIAFSGHVSPNHTGERVLLQVQQGSSDNWATVDSGRVGPQSNYLIQHAWGTPGERNVRAVFPGDRRDQRAASDTVMVAIQQAPVPDFTISANEPIVSNGAAAVVSGILYRPGTTIPMASTPVQLFGHGAGAARFRELQGTSTGPDGSYSFDVASTTNELYQARTQAIPVRRTAALLEGVQDAVSMTASSQTSTVGGHVTFSGDVSPGKPAHVIYLQKLGHDNNWHTVEVRTLAPTSTFQFAWTFETQGETVFRARVTGGPVNVGGVSMPPVTIAVSQPPLSALPTG